MSLLSQNKSFIAVDIGSSSIKVMELDLRGARPYLVAASITPLPNGVFSNNQISKKEATAEKVAAALSEYRSGDIATVSAMPALSVFTKRVTMGAIEERELLQTIKFEAGSYIPQGSDSVKLDYSIINRKPTGELDILVVAVKNEIVDSYVETFRLAGFETGIVDIDYFSYQNAFELAYPELRDQPTCLVYVGARYSFINICKGGLPLFTGNISIGGAAITQEIARVLGVELADAETLKLEASANKNQDPDDKVQNIIAKSRRALVADLDRQIRIMWNACGIDQDLGRIFIAGGGALLDGLPEALSEATNASCELFDPFRGIEVGTEFNKEYITKLGPSMAIAAGLAIRSFGDKVEGGASA